MEPSQPPESASKRGRIREIIPSIIIGRHSPGPRNSLIDVPGVLVHTESFHRTAPSVVHTGVTTILPRRDWFEHACHAAVYAFNGCGELTGSHWLEESGILCSPILLTGSFAVGACHTGIFEYAVSEHRDSEGLVDWGLLPVVGETYDGFLSDIGAMVVQPAMARRGIARASASPIPEGNTGGGTGMMCHGFKGGTGSASRVIQSVVSKKDGDETTVNPVNYTVAALVQANYGVKRNLTIGNVPIGRLIMQEEQQARSKKSENDILPVPRERKKDGSIIVVIATDAPLHPAQLKRLATRATVGLARVGGFGSDSSGDIFLAFSTAAHIDTSRVPDAGVPTVDQSIDLLATSSINSLFEAVTDCVEESIYNSLTSAEDTEGPRGVEVKGLPLDTLKRLMAEHYVPVPFARL